MINFQLVNWYALLGLGVTILLGFGTKCLVRKVAASLPVESPSADLEPHWDKLRKMETGGGAIGHVERPIFFAALWISGAWPLLASWLAFKLLSASHCLRLVWHLLAGTWRRAMPSNPTMERDAPQGARPSL